MRLRSEYLDVPQQLEEFDQWLTAKLERIKDSEKFNSEINSLCSCIQYLAAYLDDFRTHETCNIDSICKAIIDVGQQLVCGNNFSDDEKVIASLFDSFFNLLFLTSGATDNNLKNHFLIKLVQDDIKPLIPKKSSSVNKYVFRLVDLPSTTKSDYISKCLASCFVGAHDSYSESVKTEPYFDLKIYLTTILKEYVSLILEDNSDVIQFWAICRSYLDLNAISRDSVFGRYLLNSCTIFKVRGSVSASGGHITEEILRDKLNRIGLRPNTDYNLNDVVVGEDEEIEGNKRKKKTRAYDFILPYNVNGWEPKPKLFIQSQFYAGDSGSVSHKVVDQTRSSREFTLKKYPSARFVEYLDGAGYYASLRGDLQHMLSFNDTASFFQVKSILIRLRRELQYIDFLTPVELEHTILMSETADKKSLINSLLKDGYSIDEINRALSVSLELDYISDSQDQYKIASSRIDIARRLLLLDIAANNAYPVSDAQKMTLKYLLVPGYGANKAILESELSTLFCSLCKHIDISAPVFSSDIEWLLDEGVLKRR